MPTPTKTQALRHRFVPSTPSPREEGRARRSLRGDDGVGALAFAQEEVLVEKEIGGGDGALEISVALVFSRRLTIKGGGFTCGMG